MKELLLAVETSTLRTGVALSKGEEILAHVHPEQTSRHNEILYPLIYEMMGKAGIRFGDLDLIAVSIGPGSFTGIRIGFLAAQGIAAALSLNIIPLMSLDVLNLSTAVDDEAELRLPVMNAYRGEVFTALYKGSERLSEPVSADPALVSGLAGGMLNTEPVTVFGPALDRYRPELESALGMRLRTPHQSSISPSPAALARLGYLRRNQARSPAEVEPFYLRPPDARKPKHKKDARR